MKIEKTSSGPRAPTINRVKKEWMEKGRINQLLNLAKEDGMTLYQPLSRSQNLIEAPHPCAINRASAATIFGLLPPVIQ